MWIKNILPSLLCLLTVAECFGINTKQVKATEAESHAAIYDRLLKNEEKVLIDCSGDAEELFSFKRYAGQELVLSEVINNIVNCYYTVDESAVSLGEVEYAYLDCGKDGNDEIALRVGVRGDFEREIYVIIEEIGGKLKTVYSNLEYFEKKICINEYGYIESKDSPYCESVCKEYVDGMGNYHYIATEKTDSDRFPYGNLIRRSAERENEQDYFSFAKTEIYPDRYVFDSADLNNTKSNEMDDICCGNLVGHINFPKYLKSSPYVFNASEDAANHTIFKDSRGIIEYTESLGLKLYSRKDYVKILEAKEKESGLTDEIKNGHLLNWNKFDCSSFSMNIRSISEDGDYLAYDALISRLKKNIEDDNYNGLTPELTGLSYVLSWELADDDVTVGYFIKDIDGDGIDELFFGSCRNDDNEYYSSPFDCVIYDMFAIRGGKLTHVFSGAERSRYYLCENGAIANEGASSASETVWSFYKYHEGELELIEGLYTCLDSELTEHMYYTDGSKESEVDDSVVGMYSFDFRDFAKYKYQKIDYIPIIEKEN
ncbi:hypothetical protein [Butyrivibrio sp. AE2005]|uniref:hypothetical protein n=1 Tax=Butyrivibrio sp. AE2005 TaxID=1496722 RepID=UPI00047E805F|nr:hypothetical protein [Butyrivibrio sp. AE2005]